MDTRLSWLNVVTSFLSLPLSLSQWNDINILASIMLSGQTGERWDKERMSERGEEEIENEEGIRHDGHFGIEMSKNAQRC